MTKIAHRPGCWIDGSSGVALQHGQLLQKMAAKQAVLLGETHDRFDIHRWQLHVICGLFALQPKMAVGFEMFPRRVQPVLDEWVSGTLDTAAFLEKVEWKTVWGFPPELYLPIFQFCRQFKVPMLALNCRRALVSEVGKLGWQAIPLKERDGVTPAKDAESAYRQYLFEITGGLRPDRAAQSPMDPAFDRFVRAQQTWDRAFACNIAHALASGGHHLVVGIIGRGHLEYGYGTPYQLDDLGISNAGILLPSDDAQYSPNVERPIANALFRLDTEDRGS
jgi:uncharacterized iron-regulated protein